MTAPKAHAEESGRGHETKKGHGHAADTPAQKD